MRERVIERYAFGGVEREDFVEEVLELHHLAQLLFRQVLVGDELLLEVPRRLYDVNNDDLVLKSDSLENIQQIANINLPAR